MELVFLKRKSNKFKVMLSTMAKERQTNQIKDQMHVLLLQMEHHAVANVKHFLNRPESYVNLKSGLHNFLLASCWKEFGGKRQ